MLRLCLILASASLAEGKCITDYSQGLHKMVRCKELWPLGKGISFTYNVPFACLSASGPTSCGLIVDVHGFTMNADTQDNNTNMRALGEQHGYIVVQPGAPTDALSVHFALPNWNADYRGKSCTGLALTNGTIGKQTCWNAPWQEQPIGDLAIYTWVEEALRVTAWKIDRSRVHFIGFSEGGWMAGRMLCKYPHVFASIAMLSGASNADPFECVQPTSPRVPLLVNQGLNDYSSEWREFSPGFQKLKAKWGLGEGKVIAGNSSCHQEWEFDCSVFGCSCQGFADWYGVSFRPKSFGCAATATAQKWFRSNKCHKVTASPGAYQGGCEGCFSRTQYQGPAGAQVELIAYDYVADYMLKGHCFPGGDNIKVHVGDELYAFGCPGAVERATGAKVGYKIGEEAMKFFLAHPKTRKESSEIVV